MQDFFSGIFLGPREPIYTTPARRTVTRLHYPPERREQNYARDQGRPQRWTDYCGEFGRTCGLERLLWVKPGVNYQLIRDGKIKSCSLRKPGAQTGRPTHTSRERAEVCGVESQMKTLQKHPLPQFVRDLKPHCSGSRWRVTPVKMAGKLSVTTAPVIVTRRGVGYRNCEGVLLASTARTRFVSYSNLDTP